MNVYASAEAMSRLITPTVNPNWLHSAAFDSAVWWHAVDYSSLCDAKSSSTSSPASSGPTTSRSETVAYIRPDDAPSGNIVRLENSVGSGSHLGASILPEISTQAVQTPNKITELDLLFNGDYADPALASDMLWSYVMDESNDIPGVAMPFDSPYWKDLSCHGI